MRAISGQRIIGLDKESAKGCLYADLNEFFTGGEETLSLTYKAVIGGVRGDSCNTRTAFL